MNTLYTSVSKTKTLTTLFRMRVMKTLALIIILCFTTNAVAQNNALHFNGASNNVTLNYNAALDFSLTSKFSIEGWFKTTNNTAVLYSNIIDLSPFVGHEVAVVNNKVVFSLAGNYLTSMIRVETINPYNDGNWHHFATVYKGIPTASNVDIYVDGTIQTVSVTNNNLSTAPNSGNAAHIGCRNNTAYFLTGTLDEIRIWDKALCSNEIVARKNCQLVGNEPNLVGYYNFNQGIAAGNNATVTSLTDLSVNNNTGTLTSFALTGATSNWITSTTGVSGTCSYNGPITIAAANGTICAGTSVTLTGSGATSYTWSTASTNTSIAVSPSITTTYTVFGTNSINGCYASSSFTQLVSPCTGIQVYLPGTQLSASPNPNTGLFNLNGLEVGMNVEVYSILGALVYTSNAESSNMQIDISTQNRGVYFVKCFAPNQVFLLKIIKE